MECVSGDTRPLSNLGIRRLWHVLTAETRVEGPGDVKRLAREAIRACVGLEEDVVLDSNENIGTRFMLYRLRPINETGEEKVRVRIVAREGVLYQIIVLVGSRS